MDKFFSKLNDLNINNVLLIACASTIISAKTEEIFPPSLKHFLMAFDCEVTKDEIIEIESTILKILDFSIMKTPFLSYTNYLSDLLQLNEVQICLIYYLLELSMMDVNFINFR